MGSSYTIFLIVTRYLLLDVISLAGKTYILLGANSSSAIIPSSDLKAFFISFKCIGIR